MRIGVAVTVLLVLAGCEASSGLNRSTSEGPQAQSALSSAADTCGDACGSSVLTAGHSCCQGASSIVYDVSTHCCTSDGVQPRYPIQVLTSCPNRVPHSTPPTTNGCSVQRP